MPKSEHGLKRAISEIITGLATSIILSSFANAGLLSTPFVLLFNILGIISTILMVFAMRFWATGYCIGWLVGLWAMYTSGLVDIFELLIYLVPLIVLIVRFVKKFE
ncbi:MAG: hypothetical protein QW743_00945 [Candidatus Methanomethylicia archaeon]